MMNTMPLVNTYPLSNYTFESNKQPKFPKETSKDARLDRMKQNYSKEGMRTTVDGILLVHHHNHPHVLLLKTGTTYHKLPGGKLRQGENEIEGLKRKLSSYLAPTQPEIQPDWQIGECVGIWWRPTFESPSVYPYCPPHITKPKECKKLYIVHLSEREYFEVPRNYNVIAVPLFEFYDNTEKYGTILSSIPQLLSKFQFQCISPSD